MRNLVIVLLSMLFVFGCDRSINEHKAGAIINSGSTGGSGVNDACNTSWNTAAVMVDNIVGVNGIVKSDGTTISAAVAGVDYQGVLNNTVDANVKDFNSSGVIDFNQTNNIRVVFEGDSLSDIGHEYCPTNTCWNTILLGLNTPLSRAVMYNFAYTAQPASTMVGQYATQAGASGVKPTRKSDVCYFFLWAGSNDFRFNNDTAENIYSNLKTIWQYARNDKYIVTAFTVMDAADFNDVKRLKLAQLNRMILSDTNLYDYLIRPDLLFPNPNDTTYIYDGIHCTTLGYSLLASVVKDTLFSPPVQISTFTSADRTKAGMSLLLNPGGSRVTARGGVLEDSEIGTWRFTAGGLYDDSGYDRTGTAVNGAYVDFNEALYLDGTDDYVSVPVSFGSGAYTKAGWIKRADGAFSNNIISSIDCDCHDLFAPSGLSFHLAAGNGDTGSGWYNTVEDSCSLQAGKWYHAAVTYDPCVAGGTMILYRDGNQVDIATSVAPAANSVLSAIGAFYAYGGIGFFGSGELDDVHVFNRALSWTEIRRLYDNEKKDDDLCRDKVFLSADVNITSESFVKIFNGLSVNTDKNYILLASLFVVASGTFNVSVDVNGTATVDNISGIISKRAGTINSATYLLQSLATPQTISAVTAFNGISLEMSLEVNTGGTVTIDVNGTTGNSLLIKRGSYITLEEIP